VDRPTPIDFSAPAITPDFHTESQFGCMPPRDVLLTVGSEILEATMSYRCRWFEYLCYRPLMQKYWEEDSNFRHEAAPKPRLTNADYHPDYLKGPEKCAEKFGEEAIELIIEAVKNDSDGLINEAADVMYHLLVLLKSREISLSHVMTELERRTAHSGLTEKAARKT
jgi:phosphoribosyl-ATP pyrophosphohydrolase